jgi:uncharacterized protein (DUF697 family)
MSEPLPAEPWMQALSEPLSRLDDLLQHLPDVSGGGVRQRLRSFVQDLRSLTIDARGPRLLLLGRRGAGKSALAKALFGDLVGLSGWLEGQPAPNGGWYGQTLPGVGPVDVYELTIDGPTLDQPAGDWQDRLQALMAGGDIDVVILVQSIEDHAYGPTDRRAVDALWSERVDWSRLFVTASRIDAVNPPGWQPPYDLVNPTHRKAQVILDLTRRMEGDFTRTRPAVVPASLYWDAESGSLLDYRYNLAPLQDALYEALPLRAKLVFARSARHTQGRLADLVIEEAALITFALGLNPVPLADALPISLVQGIQVLLIMAFAGRSPDWPTAVQFINRLGIGGLAAMTGREVIRNLAKLVPGAGDVVSAGLATATTIALGETAKQVFTGQTSEKDSVGTFDVLRRGWEKKLRAVRSEAELLGLFQRSGQGVRPATAGA